MIEVILIKQLFCWCENKKLNANILFHHWITKIWFFIEKTKMIMNNVGLWLKVSLQIYWANAKLHLLFTQHVCSLNGQTYFMRQKYATQTFTFWCVHVFSQRRICCKLLLRSECSLGRYLWRKPMKKNRREKSDEPPLYISVHQHFLHSTWKEWSIKNLTNSIPKRLKCFSAIYPFSCIIHLEKFTFVTEKKMPKKRTAAWIF